MKEVKEILNAPLLNKSLDLPELQGNSTQEIAKQKCKIARDTIKGPVMVEDTALCFEALNNLPGPYIKWFLESIGHDGLNKMLVGFNNTRAHALCTFAYADEQTTEPIVFEGRTFGNIVQPRGPTNFGWDPIFQPDEGNGLTSVYCLLLRHF